MRRPRAELGEGFLGGKLRQETGPTWGSEPRLSECGEAGPLSVTSLREWGKPGCGEREGTQAEKKISSLKFRCEETQRKMERGDDCRSGEESGLWSQKAIYFGV